LGYLRPARSPAAQEERNPTLMPPPKDDRWKIKIPACLVARIRPIVAQRKKDTDPVYLHTSDEELAPSLTALICEAIEYYCDLLLPISTTPCQRITAAHERIKLSWLPHSEWKASLVPAAEYNAKLIRSIMEEKESTE